MVIVNLEPIAEKYIIEVGFFSKMHYIAFTNTDFHLLFDLACTQYPEILWQFCSQALLGQKKRDRKKKKDLQSLTTSVFTLPQLIYESAEQLRSH